MHESMDAQLPLAAGYAMHRHGRELEAISAILDAHPELVELVARDLPRAPRTKGGRPGMTAEQVLRATVLKQMHGLSYEQLEFGLADSVSFQTFCRLRAWSPVKRSTLQSNIKRIQATTLEAIHAILIAQARQDGLETGETVRFDCTVTDSNIHEPGDAALLWDVIRVLTRTMKKARETFGTSSCDHTERSKRRAFGIRNARSERQRRGLYRDLLAAAEKTLEVAQRAAAELEHAPVRDERELLVAMKLRAELVHYVPLGEQVVSQTRRRVFEGETVPASEKVVSIFEEHTDIIVKDRRDTLFGHKIALATGSSHLVLDLKVLEGNPADSTLAVDLVDRQTRLHGRPPRQAAFDGGFASRPNLAAIKARGVDDVVFSKKRGLKVSEMVRQPWTYLELRDFRAGIEATISFLKRSFGLRRCLWRGFASFRSYVWASVLASNLLVLARHRLSSGLG